MESDERIKNDVEQHLRRDPALQTADIAVSVREGVVTLSGFGLTQAQALEAEAAAKRVDGVAAVANNVRVKAPGEQTRGDPELAHAAVQALKEQLPYSSQDIRVVVHDAWLTLEGQVEWNYQRERAAQTAQRVEGIRGVMNAIAVVPRPVAADVRKAIEEALKRRAEVAARLLDVEMHDGEVTLRGTVACALDKEEAIRAAWSAPGVRNVVDWLTVRS